MVVGRATYLAIDHGLNGLSAGGRRGWSLRHGLIVLQFVVLIGLGSMSWIALDQLRFMQDDSLAYQTENVIRLPVASRDTAAYGQWRQRLLAAPSIAAVGMGPDPRPRRPTGTFALSGDPDRIYEGGQVQTVDVHWFDVMGIDHPVVEAMKRNGADAPQRTLINETAAALLDDVAPAGRQWIADPGDGNYATPPIEGTLPDFYFHSMRQELAPTAYRIHAPVVHKYPRAIRTGSPRDRHGSRTHRVERPATGHAVPGVVRERPGGGHRPREPRRLSNTPA
mgnify:FL=1